MFERFMLPLKFRKMCFDCHFTASFIRPNSQRKRDAGAVFPSLPQGKLNAVRAAFKAGVTPARIARQFGLSHSSVRKALALTCRVADHRGAA
jgi:hypothetical protein